MKNKRVIIPTILVIALALTGIAGATSQSKVNTQSQYGTTGHQTNAYGNSQASGTTSPSIAEGFAISDYDYALGYSMGIGNAINLDAGSSIQSPSDVNSIGSSYANGDYASTGSTGTASNNNQYNSAGTDEYANANSQISAFGYVWSFSWS